jgi:hypothetical protein
MLDEMLLEARIALDAERAQARHMEQQTGVCTNSAQITGVSAHVLEVTA